MAINARFTAREIGALSTLITRDRIIEHHEQYGLRVAPGVAECILPRRGVSSDYLAYTNKDGSQALYAITPRNLGEGESFAVHWDAAGRVAAEQAAQERGAELGYVFVATRAHSPRTLNYLVVPPHLLDTLLSNPNGPLKMSKAGRITANMELASVNREAASSEEEQKMWNSIYFQITL